MAIGLKAQEGTLKNDPLKIEPAPLSTSPTTTRPVGTDTLKIKNNGIETTILYYAEDSIITKTATNVTYLYGNAYIEYGDIKLDAAQIIIDRNQNELTAKGVQDSTGSWIGLPVFQDKGGVYETRAIRYNFATNRAKITGVVTKQDEGYVSGEEIKKNQDGSAYIKGGKFIPCADLLATTYIKADKIKVIPGDKIITGPAQLYIGDIPTIFALPFAFFPDVKSDAQSGILFPKYGEERVRGIFLREGGYFFGNNEYIRTAVTGDYYSKGSYGLNVRSTYKKRYKYSGSVDLRFSKSKTPAIDENPLNSKDFWVSISHRPESRSKTRFSASVNAGTSSYNNNNISTENFQNTIRSEFRSNLSLTGSFANDRFSYGLSARHSQNIQTNILDVSLPEFSLNMTRLVPFAQSKQEVLKRLSLSWAFSTSNRITNLVRPNSAGFDIANSADQADTIAVTFAKLPELLSNAQNGARHSIPISTSFPFLKNFNISPSINLQELWYLEELDYTYLENQNAVRIDTLKGFSRATTYGASVGISTQLYGTKDFKANSKIESIRHTLVPNLSFSYRPDFGQEKYGYYKNVQVDTTSTGEPVHQFLSKYNGFVYGSPTLGESAAIGFSLNNKVEMKVRSDTAKSEKVSILENLSFSTSYNFLADSFNLSDYNLTARTSLFKKKIDVSAGLVIDPYTYVTTNDGERDLIRKVDVIALTQGKGLGRISSGRFSLSTNLNSKASTNKSSSSMGGGPGSVGAIDGMGMGNNFGNETDEGYGTMNSGEANKQRRVPQYFDDPNAYIDITVPWNIMFSYNYSFSQGLFNNEFTSTTRQSIKMSGNMEISPKWQLTFNTGYDIQLKEFTQSSLGVYRDLGCWELRGNWIPFGRFTSYSIDIQIKASALRDLKLSRRRSFFDN
ncbi:putative LPS assembly protein LptD [Roseivirga echinicomitans]